MKVSLAVEVQQVQTQWLGVVCSDCHKTTFSFADQRSALMPS